MPNANPKYYPGRRDPRQKTKANPHMHRLAMPLSIDASSALAASPDSHQFSRHQSRLPSSTKHGLESSVWVCNVQACAGPMSGSACATLQRSAAIPYTSASLPCHLNHAPSLGPTPTRPVRRRRCSRAARARPDCGRASPLYPPWKCQSPFFPNLKVLFTVVSVRGILTTYLPLRNYGKSGSSQQGDNQGSGAGCGAHRNPRAILWKRLEKGP
ncbi:hypothetical protein B0H67DRAFT_586156 [Lasiosphaeris hirsuta]|uniref:Uncharacterized protein n=1 Tax=Lasiosphaeris hirsuta TaxID=260670 RepID=A0AA40A9E7_9PEZI|nr:hypothetical protein B0H67DRAFT_586156 [Lasiosphaeris hirsuta]